MGEERGPIVIACKSCMYTRMIIKGISSVNISTCQEFRLVVNVVRETSTCMCTHSPDQCQSKHLHMVTP